MRCIADAQAVGQRLLTAWQIANPGVSANVARPAAAAPDTREHAANDPIAAA
jgi:hypothetical protein